MMRLWVSPATDSASAYSVADYKQCPVTRGHSLQPVGVPDFFATVLAAVGVDAAKELYAGDRPVPITDRGRPIAELFS